MSFTVGSENNTLETQKTSIMGEVGMFVARLWKMAKYPMPYERTFTVDGIRVRVQVGEAEKKPKGEIDSEMSQDA